jgi:hypothetical protein
MPLLADSGVATPRGTLRKLDEEARKISEHQK